MKYTIQDWAGNEIFDGQEYDSFDDAEGELAAWLDNLSDASYETDRQEYDIIPVKGN